LPEIGQFVFHGHREFCNGLQSEINQLDAKAKHEIFSRRKSHLDDANIVIALLDGSQVDD
jgi:hypothetical protein